MAEGWLRIIHINDVYQLKYLPRFATAQRLLRSKAPHAITVLGGDFVAPSLLSSLDCGFGNINVLNACGIDYACIGNHENDIPHDQLLKRIAESKFKWINTNMKDFKLPDEVRRECAWLKVHDGEDQPRMPEFDIIEVPTEGGEVFKVALLGMNTPDPSLYPVSCFGGATITNIADTLGEYKKRLSEEADLIIPITHQGITQDEKLAAEHAKDIPLILGGHDHEEHVKEIDGCWVVKVGMDAKRVGVIDVHMKKGSRPTVKVMVKSAEDFDEDPSVKELVDQHSEVLRDLDAAVLFQAPKPLSSKNIRLQQTSMGTLLVSALRDAHRADCAMINSGAIRAGKDYEEGYGFTYSDLKSEMPFESAVVAVDLPGKVIEDAIRHSRSGAYEDPPVARGAFLQCCDAVCWDKKSQTVTSLGGAPLDVVKKYRTVVLFHSLHSQDNIVPLIQYTKEHPELPNSEDSCRGAKSVIVSLFARAAWWHFLRSSGITFKKIDTNGDGTLSKDEFISAAKDCPRLGKLVLDNLWKLMDANQDGVVTPREFYSFTLLYSFEEIDTDKTGTLSIDEAVDLSCRVLGKAKRYEELSRSVFNELAKGATEIPRAVFRQALLRSWRSSEQRVLV